MRKLVIVALMLCAALLGVVVVRAVRVMSDGRSAETKTRSSTKLLKRWITDKADLAEIRRIARAEARKAAEREARKKKREREEEAKRQAEERRKAMKLLAQEWEREQKLLSPAEKKILDELNEAMCGDDFETVSFAAEELAKSANPVVRRMVVDAISWFGERGLPELTPFLVDENEEVASLAKERWSLGVGEIEDDQEKATMAKLGMLYVTDEDSLTSFMGDLTTVSDDLVIMQTLVDLIEEGTPESAAVAREQYEWMTGDAWTDIDAAESWLQENYEMPD